MCGARECVTTSIYSVIEDIAFCCGVCGLSALGPAGCGWVWCTRRWGNNVLNVTKSRVKTRLPGQILENGPGYLVFRTKRGQVTWICKAVDQRDYPIDRYPPPVCGTFSFGFARTQGVRTQGARYTPCSYARRQRRSRSAPASFSSLCL